MKIKRYFVEDIPRRKFLQMSLKGGVALAATPALLSHYLSGKAVDQGTQVSLDPGIYDKTIQKALEKGGEFAEVYVENRISRRILTEESKFKSAVYSISQGAGVRVISGDKTGYAYTDDITEEALLRSADVASYIARGTKAAKPANVNPQERESFVEVCVI